MTQEGNKEKTISFRVEEDTRKELRELDQSLSEIYRGMTNLYLQENFFSNGVNAYIKGEAESFEDYAQTYFESSAEFYAKELVEEYERPVDAEQLQEPIRDYLAALSFGDQTWAKESVEDIKEIDHILGNLFDRTTESLPDNQWQDYLE